MQQFVYPCAKWVRPKLFAALTGMSEKAPDNQIRYNVAEYDKWVESSMMI